MNKSIVYKSRQVADSIVFTQSRIGIDSEGRREILSCKLCDSETEMEWESFFDDLKGMWAYYG